MSKPIILVTCHWEPRTPVFSKPVLIMPQAYMDAIEVCGATPMMLPYCEGDNLDRYVELADGCLFTGGYDVSPELYGEQIRYNTVYVTPERDKHEEALYKKWMATEKPVLGVCRGLQFINVMEGGSLHQDIPVERSAIHSSTEHAVVVEKGTVMEQIFGEEELRVNSFHHQCVKRLADSLKVTAYSKEDYIIEGLEHKTKPMFAVQYHPEYQCGKWHTEGLSAMEPLFTKFIDMCK